ncbi:hypothetical protein NLG97_g7555 [Lecanicillium saksenae]|uniref:Uncharacterized protein n=1 Tax=Lecanicillium saksenae TaxID=468837 RepID=A0ACC1QP17_9HYPO|nr:hypothetical protein NLG97_g7555 [Lecanicillium saksenae]
MAPALLPQVEKSCVGTDGLTDGYCVKMEASQATLITPTSNGVRDSVLQATMASESPQIYQVSASQTRFPGISTHISTLPPGNSWSSSVQIQTRTRSFTARRAFVLSVFLSTRSGSAPDTDNGLLIVMTVVPIVCSCVLGFFIWWCCVRPARKHKRRKRQREAELANFAAFTPVPASNAQTS